MAGRRDQAALPGPRKPALKVAFAGTPEFARVALEAIADAGFDVPLVLTQPDRPAGRGLKLQPSAVRQLALDRGWPVAQPRSLRLDGKYPDDAAAAADTLAAAAPDVLVVAAYGLILPAWVLALPRLGCLNIHGSLLPRWRGAAPIHRAIEAGDDHTGITIMQMDSGLDTGPMLLAETTAIAPDDDTGRLHDRLAALGARLIVQALHDACAGRLRPQAQAAEGVTYAHKVEKVESVIDWRAPAVAIERRARAFDPFPGLQFALAGAPVKLWRAAVVSRSGAPGTVLAAGDGRLVVACGEGALDLLELQAAGGRRLPAAAFLRGHPVAAGTVLGALPGPSS
jgi:methionyl-tRNA formyltransferase